MERKYYDILTDELRWKLERSTLYDIWKKLKEKDEREALEILNEISKEFLELEISKDINILSNILIRELERVSEKKEDIKFLRRELKFLKKIRNRLNDLTNLEKRDAYISLSGKRIRYKKVLRDTLNLLKDLKAKLIENVEKEDFINALLYYSEYMKNVYRAISLLSLKQIRSFSKALKVDPLTGLLNRRVLPYILRDVLELSLYTETPFSIAMVDIDNFKKINDTYGHLFGDKVLKEVAKIIKKNLRRSDYVFRYGGEEFLILMPSTELKDAVRILEKIRKEVENTPICWQGKEIRVTISVGVCSDVYNGLKSPEEYIKCADEKLYLAKRTGKNRVVF
ncbi:GGDEF domain-containing protein [Aquifex aeolicus]|uniref:diguanylate cyclase n=1 Tax=Aquifex aeolicus (strain VF5) TaxID=224324 RepID=O66623_AQUAE|nr:GGDEF domain-containing protein [Aquifex aeolicus]AAC06589.1 hypothetical protein aq_265 [Aquifex aeolicus VF5]